MHSPFTVLAACQAVSWCYVSRYAPRSATAQRDAARRHTRSAYDSRNELLGLLARLWPSHFMPVARSLSSLSERVTLCIHPPNGERLAWVLDRLEAESEDFAGVPYLSESHWDQCKASERTARIRKLPLDK